MGAKALVLVIPIELEIFYCDWGAKALVLVITTELEIFYRDLGAKALVLVDYRRFTGFWEQTPEIWSFLQK